MFWMRTPEEDDATRRVEFSQKPVDRVWLRWGAAAAAAEPPTGQPTAPGPKKLQCVVSLLADHTGGCQLGRHPPCHRRRPKAFAGLQVANAGMEAGNGEGSEQ
eukprot:COSAG02_NODE_5587_length_4209_cov_1.663504_3_plen_103_part_00